MEGPYSRVYWSVLDDDRFDGVRDDVRLFGAWAMLLVVADMAWPASAFVPPMVPKTALQRLVGTGLVVDLGGHRYRIHGLDKEREMRAQWGRDGAALRWHKPTNGVPMQAETSIDKHRQPTRARPRARLVADDEPMGPDEAKAVTAELIARSLKR